MEQQVKEAFFFVWNEARGLPKHRHETEHAAWAEAKRLALKQRGEKFYVLQSIGECITDEVICIPHSSIPF